MPSFSLICRPHWHLSILFYRRTPTGTGVHCSKRHLPRPRNSYHLTAFWFTTVSRVHLCWLRMLHHTVSERFCLILFQMALRSPLHMLPVHLPHQNVGTLKLLRKLLPLFLVSQSLDSTYLVVTSLFNLIINHLFTSSITTRLYQLQLHLEFSDDHLS